MKDRRQKIIEYENNYSEVPREKEQRIEYLYNKYKLDNDSANNILALRSNFINNIFYDILEFTLYEEPEFCPRPRATVINRRNTIDSLKSNSFIHIYSENAKDNHDYFHMYAKEHLINKLEQLICTPCIVELDCYFPTPKQFNVNDIFMAEMGLIRPLIKPDQDNIAKNYLDCFTGALTLDDIFITDLIVRKYYSCLPRVECLLSWANMLGNKFQYKAVIHRKDFLPNMNVSFVSQI